MAKQCATVIDKQGNIDSVILKNYDNITPLERAVKRNKGYSMDKASNGEPSLLYQFYTDEMNMSPEEAEFVVANTFSTEFGDWFGRWWEDGADASKVVDINGQPKPVWSGHEERLTTHNAYTNREEDDRISNDAFFPESKKLAQTYSTGGGVDFLNAPAQYVKYLVANSVEPVFLNIRNPRIVEHNKGTQITPLIQSGEAKANDGFYGDSSNQVGRGLKTWAIMDDSQVIYLDAVSEMNNDIQVESDNTIIIESIEKIRNEANSIESETFENVSKNNINFQIIGEKGASKLKDAENIIASNKIAKKMDEAGKDAKTIYMATSWEKGVDGKWRYELPDMFDEKKISLKKYTNIVKSTTVPLSVFLSKDSEILQAYPISKATTVTFMPFSMTVEANGSFNSSMNNIVIYKDLHSSENIIKEILVHELQHLIQVEEGFAQGGNLNTIHNIMDKIPDNLLMQAVNRLIQEEEFKKEGKDTIDNLNKQLEEISNLQKYFFQQSKIFRENNTKLNIEYNFNPFLNTLLGKYVGKEVIKKYMVSEKQFVVLKDLETKKENYKKMAESLLNNTDPRLVFKGRLYDIQSNKQIIKDIQNRISKLNSEKNFNTIYHKLSNLHKEHIAFAAYKRLSGEVEARNVSHRLKMSNTERLNTLLQETEDIPREEQIQIFEASGIPNSSIELVPSELIKRLTDRLLQKNLVSKVSLFTNEQIVIKLKELGISDKIVKKIEAWHGSPHFFDDLLTNEVIQFNKELSNAGLKPIIGGFFNSQTKEVYLNEDSNDLLISTLHEFSHPMLQWLRDNRRGHFDAGIEVLKNNSEEAQAYIDKVKELYPNLKENSDTFYEEVLATIIGDKGAELIRSKEDSNIQTWISDLWKMFKDMMGLTEYSIEEVSNMSLQEFSDAINAEMFNSDGDMKDDTLLQIEVQQNEFIPSQLFEELSQQPFMTKEQALDIYQHIYTEGLNEWKDNDMTC